VFRDGGENNHAHFQIEFFIYKASHFPGFSRNRGPGGEGARQLSDAQRDRVWQKRFYDNVSIKEIIDDDIKRIVFVHTYTEIDLQKYYIDIYRVCV